MRLLSLLGICTLSIAANAAQLRVQGDRSIARIPRSVDDKLGWSFKPNHYSYAITQANLVSQKSLMKMVEIFSSDIVVSSFGVSLSFYMISLGAGNTTGRDFDVAFGLSHKSLLASQMQTMLNDLTNYKEFPFRVAIGFFVSPHFQIEPDFGETLEKLEITAESVNFKNSDDANEIISRWCKTHTNERITNDLSSDDSDKAMHITNAVYFKGTWLHKFVISATEPRTFRLDDGTEKQVPSMAVTGMFLHGELPEMAATFVQLPFKSKAINAIMNMFIILPQKIEGYNPFRIKFTWLVSSQLILSGKVGKVYVELPKFKISNKIHLKEFVTQPDVSYNLSSLFDPREADFSDFATFPQLFLKEVVQDSVIEINEEGCEAVSAMGDSTDASKEGATAFLADRPFYALITTGGEIPLFIFGAWISGISSRTKRTHVVQDAIKNHSSRDGLIF